MDFSEKYCRECGSERISVFSLGLCQFCRASREPKKAQPKEFSDYSKAVLEKYVRKSWIEKDRK